MIEISELGQQLNNVRALVQLLQESSNFLSWSKKTVFPNIRHYTSKFKAKKKRVKELSLYISLLLDLVIFPRKFSLISCWLHLGHTATTNLIPGKEKWNHHDHFNYSCLGSGASSMTTTKLSWAKQKVALPEKATTLLPSLQALGVKASLNPLSTDTFPYSTLSFP